MRQVNLQDILTMANSAREALKAAAASLGRPLRIYSHWTAGHYGQFFDHYHFSVDPGAVIMTPVDSLATVLSHTWKRNTGALGLSINCCVDAVGTHNLGPEPPTEDQVDTLAQIIAVLSVGLDVPIDVNHFPTHAEAADWDDYGPSSTVERWDLWVIRSGDEPGSGGEALREKARQYLANGSLDWLLNAA